jgi:hypothetical protein
MAYPEAVATPSPRDPIDEEIDILLSDPDIRARLTDFEDRLARGEVRTVPHSEVRRRLRLNEEQPPAHRTE